MHIALSLRKEKMANFQPIYYFYSLVDAINKPNILPNKQSNATK